MIIQKKRKSRSYLLEEEVDADIEESIKGLNDDEYNTLAQLIQKDEILIDSMVLEYEKSIVSVEEWLNEDYFFGEVGRSLYPAWKQDLVEMFDGGYEEAVITGSLGGGKRVSIENCYVFTPEGTVKVKNVKIGDVLCNPDGGICKVTALSEITEEEEIIFEFMNGTEIASCKEHLWYGATRFDHTNPCEKWDYKNCIWTSQEIYDYTIENMKKSSKQRGKRQFKIPITEPVYFKDIGGRIIDPYLLGYLLGNGTLGGANDVVKATVNEKDVEFLNEYFLGETSIIDVGEKKCKDISFVGGTRLRHIKNLKELGLWGKGCNEKFVPENYKYAPVEDRFLILQGLLDSDGGVEKGSGRIRFWTVNERLAKDVEWIAQSLGCLTSLVLRPARDKIEKDGTIYKCQPCWQLGIRSRDNSKLFKLSRKKDLCNCRKSNDVYHTIIGVRKGKKVPMRCITVDNPNGLYLINNFIVTHNSTYCQVAVCRMLYEVTCLKNPQATYKLTPDSPIVFANVGVNKTNAKKVVFEGLANYIDQSPYFRRECPALKKTQEAIIFKNNIQIAGGSSTEQNIIGMNIFGGIIDEANFFEMRGGRATNIKLGQYSNIRKLYDAIKRRRKSRFKRYGKLPGILLISSSKRTVSDFTEEKINESLNDKKIFVRDYSQYEINPDAFSKETFKVLVGNAVVKSKILEKGEEKRYEGYDELVILDVPMDFKEDFEKDISGSIKDIGGISIYAVNRFIQNVDKIQDMQNRNRKHPFTVEEWKFDEPASFMWDKMVRKNKEGVYEPIINPKAIRHAHFDPSLSGDATGFSVAHISHYVDVVRSLNINGDRTKKLEKAPFFVVDFMLKIIPPDGGEIFLSDMRNMVYEMSAHGYRIRLVTYDAFQSGDAQQILKRKGYRSEKISVDTSMEPYNTLKTAIYENRIDIYPYKPVIDELTALEKDVVRNKVDHTKTIGKDTSDSLCGVIYTLSTQGNKYETVLPTKSEYVTNEEDFKNDDSWVLEGRHAKEDQSGEKIDTPLPFIG